MVILNYLFLPYFIPVYIQINSTNLDYNLSIILLVGPRNRMT